MNYEKNYRFAVLDCETNNEDQVISVGVVIVDGEFNVLEGLYYILYPECHVAGMFSHMLYYVKEPAPVIDKRLNIINNLIMKLKYYNVKSIYAYNATFDKRHLPELHGFQWIDIMRIARNRRFNIKLPKQLPTYQNGCIKKGYSVEKMYRYLTNEKDYQETHNAIMDAVAELIIMKVLSIDFSIYENYAILK